MKELVCSHGTNGILKTFAYTEGKEHAKLNIAIAA